MRSTLGIVIAVVVLLIVVVGSAGTYYTSKSETCGTCHQMRTFYVSWQNSSHNQVDCMQCHSDPGFMGQLVAKLQGARRLGTYMTWYFGLSDIEAGCCPFSPPMENKICLQCHIDFKENDKRVALSNHPLMKQFPVHQRHEVLDLKCTDCHAQMVHGNLYKSTSVAAENCQSCHEERGVLNPRGLLSKLVESGNDLQRLSTQGPALR